MRRSSTHALLIIVISQFCCTSLWFAGNGVLDELIATFDLPNNSLGPLTSSVQFGFIVGTLAFALLTIADRFSPSRVFFFCALLGALLNLGLLLPGNHLASLLSIRFGIGFFLAGIYPVGMKIAADYFDRGLGKALGYLVGALVLGTAFPHLLKAWSVGLPWKAVIWFTSILALIGGLMMWIGVPNGPFRKRLQRFHWSAVTKVFKNQQFRSAAFGYFGHMWELYAFWAFVPTLLILYNQGHQHPLPVSGSAFIVIAIGSISCAMGGYLAERIGHKRTARYALLVSGSCCLLSPLLISLPSWFFIPFLLTWGAAVIMDSPQFSTLVAQNCATDIKGSALTIVNCLGFAITILSIQLMNVCLNIPDFGPRSFMLLAIGPIFGLIATRR